MKTMKNLTLCIMTVGVLLIQLLSPAPVRADSETPPPSTDVPVATTVPPTLPSPTDVAPTTPDPAETSTPSPAQQDSSEPPLETPVETGAALSAEEAPSATSVLEAAQTIAENTNVVVLDETGQSLPLGSQEAAQVITNSDPVWCPAGQAPTPGTNGCTTSYATLSDLVTNEGGNIAADGTIWITSGPVPEVSKVTINGSTYTTWSNYGLTLQGGWSGVSGDATIGSNAVFSVPIEISNWNNSIVINNLNIENVVTSGKDYLKVQTDSGDITISNSNIRNNTNTSSYGAFIKLFTPDTVMIHNSNFNNNTGTSQIVIESTNLTIDHSNFTNITGESAVVYGPLIDCSPDTVSNVVISNSSFSNNNGTGLSVYPPCIISNNQYNINITIDDSSFNNNSSGAGASLVGNVTINNSSFDNNAVEGLLLQGNGTINNSSISGNRVGAELWGTVTLNDVTIANNDVGFGVGCDWPGIEVVLNLNNVNMIDNDIDVGSGNLDCNNTTARIIFNNSSIISYQSEGEFALDCASVDGYSVNLLNGDLVQLFCPVSGTARVSPLDTTALPAPLPAGYSYASAFSLDILQNETPIPVITEGGYLKASFEATSLQAREAYSILYWDNGTWVPLQELTLDENGREILSEVKLVDNNGSPRVEVSTNFPGTFVFAQH